MTFTAQDVKTLREKTGVGMMECKKALTEANGDMDKAIDYLRERGLAAAQKKATRIAAEGVVLSYADDAAKKGVVIEVNSETDFVAKNEDFVKFTHNILETAINAKAKNAGEVNQLVIDGSTVENLIVDQIAKIGEKIEISHYEVLEAPVVYAYIHPGNRLASLLSMNKTGFDEKGHDVAMQIAAMAPLALNKDAVSADIIEKELEVYRVQIREEGKPENMVEKIAEGKLNKFFKENTLLSQDFIKDSKKTVLQYLQEGDKDLTVTAFYRFMLGA